MLGELLTRNAQNNPDKTALKAGTLEVTYRELEMHSQAVAQALLELGLQPGDRVALHLLNGIETAVSYFACFRAGLIAVPCNLQLKAEEIAFALENSQARTYVVTQTLSDLIQAVRLRLPAVERIVQVDQKPGENESIDESYDFGGLPMSRDRKSLPAVAPDANAVIIYTSGTTSRPKGVLHTQRSLWHCARLLAESLDLQADERILLMCPMMHMSGLLQLLTTMFIGGMAVIVPPLDPVAALDAIERYRCTNVLGMPVAYHFMVREQERSPRRVDSLRSALGGGDSVSVALVQEFQSLFGLTILEAHGMTECAPNIVNPRRGSRPGSLGLPLAGVEARIDAAPGKTGELLLRTPAMFKRYWDDEEATRQAFQDGFLRTGDLARIDKDGFFWFAGRSKEIIVHGAANISPQDVEDVICRHPAVAQAGVVGVPDATWGESVRAFIVLKKGAVVTSDELRTYLLEKLADWKVPDTIYFRQDLPLNPTGKVNRRLLREIAQGR